MGFPTQDDRSLITCNKSGKIVNWKWHASVQYSEMVGKLFVNVIHKFSMYFFSTVVILF